MVNYYTNWSGSELVNSWLDLNPILMTQNRSLGGNSLSSVGNIKSWKSISDKHPVTTLFVMTGRCPTGRCPTPGWCPRWCTGTRATTRTSSPCSSCRWVPTMYYVNTLYNFCCSGGSLWTTISPPPRKQGNDR